KTRMEKRRSALVCGAFRSIGALCGQRFVIPKAKRTILEKSIEPQNGVCPMGNAVLLFNNPY
ncbi:MAG: hypothetical protein J5958_01840, partial [Clostridia bacterium]|nr:hypothetical protein [Clostridia bacterium]